jgi:hypothetical protein
MHPFVQRNDPVTRIERNEIPNPPIHERKPGFRFPAVLD